MVENTLKCYLEQTRKKEAQYSRSTACSVSGRCFVGCIRYRFVTKQMAFNSETLRQGPARLSLLAPTSGPKVAPKIFTAIESLKLVLFVGINLEIYLCDEELNKKCSVAQEDSFSVAQEDSFTIPKWKLFWHMQAGDS